MLINANALSIPLANKSVHTIVTSPPYYGLRDYGTAKWEGGDPECDHKEKTARNDGGRVNTSGFHGSAKDDSDKGEMNYRNVCPRCGAIRIDAQIGLEVTPDAYIANLVAVFRECKRILRDDGTLWVNIGDSYAGNMSRASNNGRAGFGTTREGIFNRGGDGIKDKDLIGIPWMLAFALRADGWYLRQDIIWAKPNPMPESVKDRCTKSHEYIFLLSKSAKYYYDNEAVKEKGVMESSGSDQRDTSETHGLGGGNSGINDAKRRMKLELQSNGYVMRNKRDVWTVTTKPYKGAHYATFNPDLIKPCILAGAPETCCAKCGAPYKRVVEREKPPAEVYTDKIRPDDVSGVLGGTAGMGQKLQDWYNEHPQTTTGYQPTCDCNAGTSSGIVFDPFVGSGTTVATAIQLGREGIGIDLSLTYLYENAKDRIEAEILPLLTLIEQE